MAQKLSGSGHKVFAINFPHANGDGYFGAEQIADAIEIIKSKTGALNVDVVAWSKGVFNTRMYASSLIQSWGTPYRDDIRKMILIGGPNDGVDWSYLHGTYGSVSVLPGCAGVVNGPAVHTTMYCFFTWQFQPDWTYSSAYFPGPKQMLKRWDSVYAPAISEFDALATYYGGWGYISYAPGIDTLRF